MLTGEKSFSKSERVYASDTTLICKWIVHTGNELHTQIIVKNFIKCCILSALDGTSDYVIWKDKINESESSDANFESANDKNPCYNDDIFDDATMMMIGGKAI